MSLGQKIREFRKERGLTLAKLAGRLEISTSYLSSVERGLRKPSIPMLKRISDELNISVGYLVGDTDDAVTAEKLRFIRENLDLSLGDLAEISEIPLSTLEKFEAGSARPDTGELKKISEALNVPLRYFLNQGERGNTLGARLKKLRTEQGLTVTALADRAGVSPGLITQIEKGQTTPLLRTLETIGEALNKPLSFFLMEREDIDDVLAELSPDVLELLDDPQVQAVLRAIREFNANELKYIINYIQFFKKNRHLL